LQRRCFATSGATLLCSDGEHRRLNFCFFFKKIYSIVAKGGQVSTHERKRKKEKNKGSFETCQGSQLCWLAKHKLLPIKMPTPFGNNNTNTLQQ